MRKLLIACVLCLAAQNISATEQTPDRIIIGRDTLPLLSQFPLETLDPARFRLFRQRIHDANVISRPGEPDVFVLNSGLWRGYVATWELRNDSLLFRSLENTAGKPADLTGICSDGDPAQWFSGEIHVGYGKCRPTAGELYEYESEAVYLLQDGLVVEKRKRLNDAERIDSLWNSLCF